MTEALDNAVHIARVCQVLQARHSVAVDSTGFYIVVRRTNLPLGDAFHLGGTLWLMKSEVTRLTPLWTVRSSQARTVHYLLSQFLLLFADTLATKGASCIGLYPEFNIILLGLSYLPRFRIFSLQILLKGSACLLTICRRLRRLLLLLVIALRVSRHYIWFNYY